METNNHYYGLVSEIVLPHPPNDFDPSIHTAIALETSIFLIDRQDLELALSRKWYVSRGYLSSKDDEGKFATFHALCILQSKPRPGMVVDHRNSIRSDNRRLNLNWISPSLNNQKSNRARTSTSGYVGVRRRADTHKFTASISMNNCTERQGGFDTAEEAARAYDLMAVKYYGALARTNFSILNYDIPEHPIADTAEIKQRTVRKSTKCKISGCPEEARSRFHMCKKHLKQHRQHKAADVVGQKMRYYTERVTEKAPHCIWEGCAKEKIFSGNMCSGHWIEKKKLEGTYKRQPIIKPRCMADGCSKLGGHRIADKQWLCRKHYNEKEGLNPKITGRPPAARASCSEPGCQDTGTVKKPWCQKHYLLEWRRRKAQSGD